MGFFLSKTTYIIFYSATVKLPEDSSINIGRKHLTKAKFLKLLGLLTEESLSWKFIHLYFQRSWLEQVGSSRKSKSFSLTTH